MCMATCKYFCNPKWIVIFQVYTNMNVRYEYEHEYKNSYEYKYELIET